MLNQYTASLWGDEAFSAVLSQNSIPKIIDIITKDTSPPLYNLTEHLWFQVFGSSEVAIRLLSTLYFVIAIFFVYKIASHLWSRKTGLLAAVLTLLNPFFFTYAFEGRMYSILAAGCAMSVYFMVKILFPKNEETTLKSRVSSIVGLGIGTAWALYSHHFAIFLIMIECVWLVITLFMKRKNTFINMFFGLALAAVLYIPWLPALYQQTKLVGGGFWLGTPTFKDLISLSQKYISGTSGMLSEISLVLGLLLLGLRKWSEDKMKTIFIASWFIGPIIIAWIISQKFQSIFYDRYLLYTIPGVAILIVSNQKRVISGIMIAILLPILLFIDYNYFIHPTKLPFREMADYVKLTKRGDDFLINWNSSAHHLWESKYYQINAPIYISGTGELPFYVGTAQMTKDDVIRKLPKANRIGVITSGDVSEIKIDKMKPKDQVTYGELKFIWYEKQ